MRTGKKWLALLAAAFLVAGVLPASVFAAEFVPQEEVMEGLDALMQEEVTEGLDALMQEGVAEGLGALLQEGAAEGLGALLQEGAAEGPDALQKENMGNAAPSPMPIADNEARYSTDGGISWTEVSFSDAAWAGINAGVTGKDVQIELLRDITLTAETWTPVSLAYNNHVTIDGKGFTVHRGTVSGLLFVVQYSNSKLTLRDITIDGGAVWSSKDPAERSNSGVSYNGGGHLIRAEEGATLVLESGVILQNNDIGTQIDGGAVRIIGNSKVEMHSGAVIRNNAGSVGGGVSIFSGTLDMKGGEIYGNYGAGNDGGGIYVGSGGTLVLSGNPLIKDNAARNGSDNIYLIDGKTVTVGGALTGEGDSMGISVQTGPTDGNPATFGAGSSSPSYTLTDSDLAKFFSDNANYRKRLENGSLKLYLPPQITEPMVSLSQASCIYNGSRQEPAVTVRATDGTLLVKDQDYRVTFTDTGKKEKEPKAAGNYLCVVTGINAYGGTVQKAFEIKKAEPVVTGPAQISLTYGQALSQAAITGGGATDPIHSGQTLAGSFTWAAPGTIPVVGTGSYRLKFLPDDSENYAEWSSDVSVTVNKAALTVTAKNQSARVGSTAPSLTDADYEVTGFVNGEGLGDISAEAGISISYEHTPDMGVEGETAILVTGSGETANYILSYVNARLIVARKEVPSITAEHITAAMDDRNLKVSASTSGDGPLSYQVIEGTDVIRVDSEGNITVLKAGTAKIAITVEETETYARAVKEIVVTIREADGTGSLQPSGSAVTVPVSGDRNTVYVEAVINGSTAAVRELDQKDIERVISGDGSSGMVVIDLSGLEQRIDKADLPIKTLEAVGKAAGQDTAANGRLAVRFPAGTVVLEKKAMEAIIAQAEGSQVRLVLEETGVSRLNSAQQSAVSSLKVYGGVEVYLICTETNKRISDFKGGTATLSILFTVPKGLKASGFFVWYVDEKGGKTRLNTEYKEGQLVWSVGHFSDFIIAYEAAEAEDGTKPFSPGGTGTADGLKPGQTNSSPKTGEGRADGFWAVLLLGSLAGLRSIRLIKSS